MKRWLVAAAITAVGAGLIAPAATAATKDAHGWWWRAQTGLLGTAIPPPGVPEDGLAVETLPDGPTAVAALRYLLDNGEEQPVLVLTVAGQHGEVTIKACPATQHWTSDHGGPWDERPTWDCGAGVNGEPSKDGATWQWELAPLVRRSRLNVVLVPDPGSGRVTFEAPDDASLQTQSGNGGQDFDPPPVSDFTDPGTSSGAGSSDDFAPPASTMPQSGTGGPAFSAPPPAAGPPVSSSLASPAPQAPLAAAPATAPEQTAAPVAPAAAVPASSDQSRTIGAIVAAMAAVLALGLWHQDSADARRSVALANAGIGASAQFVGGLGRFARPRSGSAPPLL